VAADAGDSTTVRRMGRLTGISGLTAGLTYYVSATAGAITSTAPSNTRRVGVADTTSSLVVAAEIVEPLVGFYPIDLSVWREISGGDIPVTASDAGILSSNSTPAFIRINGATDKGLRINWVGGNSDEITACWNYPPDLDNANPIVFEFVAASAGATNSPAVGVAFFVGVGDTNAGGNSAAVTGTTPTKYSVTIAAADVGAYPNFASISLTPAAHATDALRIYSTAIRYVKKLKST
jgi:hypothetical protein